MKLKTVTSFILFVVVPTIVAMAYYISYASDQYLIKTQYIIQSGGNTVTTDVLGAITGLPGQSGDAKSSYIAQSYIESPAFLSELDKELGIRQLYGNEVYDAWARLDVEASFADFLEYWNDQILISYDSTSGITFLEVTAFDPEIGVNIANKILEKAEQHVNNLSERSRNDSLKFAQNELEKAEHKLISARSDLKKFRDKKNEIDPEKTTEAKIGIVTQLESELSTTEVELRSISKYMKPNAFKVRTKRNKIDVLKKQIANERRRWGSASNNKTEGLSSLIGGYEKHLAKKVVAERFYESAILSMEAARLNAILQHKYLEVISSPQLPDEAEKPYRIENIITVLIGSFLAWVIGSLVISAVKDHV